MTSKGVRVRRASRHFGAFLKLTLGRFLLNRYNVAGENLAVLRRLRPPYLLLANHFTTWDPFLLGCFIPVPVYNVTSDMQFRSAVMRFLLGLVGAIPKTKVVSDLGTVRKILAVVRVGGVVGIYPEGRRSWDGHTSAILFSTAKLVKVLRLPVVIAVMKGGYLSLPRWTRFRRRGRILFDFHLALSAAETRELSAGEVYRRMVDTIEHDEYEFQRSQMLPYRGRRAAERLELALFACPSCRAIGSLASSGRLFGCGRCGYRVRYNAYGFFEPRSGALRFATVRDWNLWQLGFLEEALSSAFARGDSAPVLAERNLLIQVGYRTRPLRRFHYGDMTLFLDRIEFKTLVHGTISFPIAEIAGINVQIQERLEFYFRGMLYRFHSGRRPVCGYLWMNAVEILQRLATGRSSSEAR